MSEKVVDLENSINLFKKPENRKFCHSANKKTINLWTEMTMLALVIVLSF